MEFQEGICKVCLEKREKCRFIDGNTTNILSMLLPKTEFTGIQGPVICRNCADMLTRCYDFKVMCLRTYKSIVRLVNKKSVKLSIKDVYLSKNATATGVPEDQDICGFCVGLVKNVPTASLSMLKKMIQQCLPELDLNIIEKLVICAPCLGSLENCFCFVTSCLIAEEKIKKYRDTLGADCKGDIELSNVLQFSIRHSADRIDGNLFGKIKVEQQFCDGSESPDGGEINNRGDVIKLEKTFGYDCEHPIEDVEIKNEILLEMDCGEDDHQFTSKNMLKLEEETDTPDFIKIEGLFCEENESEHKAENLAETVDQTFLLNEEIEIKTEDDNFNSFKHDTVLPQPEDTTLLLRKQERLTSDVDGDSEVTMYQCDSCSYQTKYKRRLKAHSLMHKDPSEVQMYRCDLCSYQTKYRQQLNWHSLKHKDPSEVTMYKCASCSYQTNHKGNLLQHLVKHEDPSKVTIYQCDFCPYQTKYKHHFKSHSLMHKDSSEVPVYKCDHCLFMTKRSYCLQKHLLTHKDPSEITMHKCPICLYQTNRTSNLKDHLLTHRDPSEVTLYKCDTCLYQTKSKRVLKRHLLTHEALSAPPIYKCDACSFQTKYKYTLNTHFLKHKDPSEITMYRCDLCPYQAKCKKYLKKHLALKHLSAVPIYKCDTCSFQTNGKYILKNHLVTHMDPSELTMYKCDTCLYQTKYKRCLKRHFLTHKKPRK